MIEKDISEVIPQHNVYTVSPSSKALLESLGVWELLEPSRLSKVDCMEVWEAGGKAFSKWTDIKKPEKSEKADEKAKTDEKEKATEKLEAKANEKEKAEKLEKSNEAAKSTAAKGETKTEEKDKTDDKETKTPEKQEDINIMGYTVESGHLQAALHHKLEGEGIVERKISTRIRDLYTKETECANIKLEDGTKLSADLVIGCEGSESFVYKAIKNPEKTEEHFGFICTVQTDVKTDRIWEKFLDSGPLALLPCWGNYYALFWSCDKDLYKFLSDLDDEHFIKEFNFNLTKKPKTEKEEPPAEGEEMPPTVLKVVRSRKSFPLNTTQAEKYVDKRLVLIGEAAHSVHPFAGQGLNLGLMDVEVLTHVLNKIIAAEKDIGDKDLLQEFETKAKLYNYLMMGGIEMMMQEYDNSLLAFVQTRSFVLSALNSLGITKKAFNEISSGTSYRDMIINSDNEEFWKGIKILQGLVKSDALPKLLDI